MLTRLSFKVSFFAALMTFISCFMMNVPLGECTKRSLIVFAGFYLILISFFILLRLIIKPGEAERLEPQKGVESGEGDESEQFTGADTIGVKSE